MVPPGGFMPKKARELSALDVKRLLTPGRHAVGIVPGLLFNVKETGARSWLLRTMIGGKRRSIGLGGYPEVSLSEARSRARGFKAAINEGIDPIEKRRRLKNSLIEAQTEKMSFGEAARLCHEKKSYEFKSKKHQADWINSIDRYATPMIGEIPVSEINLTHILKVLEPIWTEKTETATRLRQRIEAILSWATVFGHREGANPARWRGHLDAILPRPSKLRRVQHYRALPWQKINSFMVDLKGREGIAARCLEFLILTAARSGEVRFSTWPEVDLENCIWTIPGARMKNGNSHRVPLSTRAVYLLENLPRLLNCDFIFPSTRGGPLSDMALNMTIRRMKVDAVPHGFRATFRDWAAEETNFSRAVAEMALAHTIKNKTESAYRRGDLLEKRRTLMQYWADFCGPV